MKVYLSCQRIILIRSSSSACAPVQWLTALLHRRRGSRVKVFFFFLGGGLLGAWQGGQEIIFPDSVCAKLSVGGVQGPALGPLAGCRGRAPAGGPGGGAPGSSRKLAI